MRYNWQQADWPNFYFDSSRCEAKLAEYERRLGRLSGFSAGLSKPQQAEALLDLMVLEAVKTSEIEGEFYSRSDVMSSIKNNLGLNNPQAVVKHRGANGVGELMAAVRNDWKQALSQQTLFDWHSMLMANAPRHVAVGRWRTHEEPMQIVSGAIGKTKVHFEAPPSAQLPQHMQQWLNWFAATAPGETDEISRGPIRAALAHLYFESIHPFEDGNGRIGRAIAEKALAQSAGEPLLFSLSKAIHADKAGYYAALQQAQTASAVDDWVIWFVDTLLKAQQDAERQIEFTLKKVRFLDAYRADINKRQEKALLRMLAEGPDGFDGGMSPKKYRGITAAASATATRDLAELVAMGALQAKGEGRGRRYELAIDNR